MGADLYIKKITDTEEKPWDSEEGYFRDSYNGTSVLWTLGLSWWQDVIPLLTEEGGDLEGENLKKFRDMVASAEQELPTEKKLREMWCAITEEETLESWHNYYKEKRDNLLAFVDRAISLESGIHCSL